MTTTPLKCPSAFGILLSSTLAAGTVASASAEPSFSHKHTHQHSQTAIGCSDPMAEGQRVLRLGSLMPTAHAVTPAAIHPWPFPPLSIGHTSASYQNYSGEAYFHHGLDIRGAAGTPILASVGGRVANIENYIPGNLAYWEVAILDDEGFLWQYHHIEKSSIPAGIWNSWRNGVKVEAGAKLGEIFKWGNYSFGERYDHLHLNVLASGGTYMSPFLFLESLPDRVAPAILAAGVLQGGRSVDDSDVDGPYSLYATIHDLILHTKYVVPPHRVEIAIDGAASELVWDFQSLPGGANINRSVDEFFVPDMTCGDYTCRELTINLAFKPEPLALNNNHDVRKFPTTPGQHFAVVSAWDFEGNSVSKKIEWTVIKPTIIEP